MEKILSRAEECSHWIQKMEDAEISSKRGGYLQKYESEFLTLLTGNHLQGETDFSPKVLKQTEHLADNQRDERLQVLEETPQTKRSEKQYQEKSSASLAEYKQDYKLRMRLKMQGEKN
ncbi:hypothetical protein Tco_0753729 [Tanacetum coccineum]